MANRRILTVSELADHLNVHRITIYRLLKSGNLPGFKIGRVWRFDLDDITEWMASGKTSEALYNHDGYLPSHLDGKPPSTAGDGKPPMTHVDKSSTHHDGAASNDGARELRRPQARHQPPSASRSNDTTSLRGGNGGKSAR